MKIIENKILNTVSIIIVAVIVFLGVVNGVVANSNDDRIMTGFAWSDTIGWVSFNSSDIVGSTVEYSVIIDGDTGNFSGYAWSDNIGWIDFAPISGYPEAPNYGARLNPDGSITGWARALSYDGGWDGWINLNGDDYGVTLEESTGLINGYAWGSDVVGWLAFGSSVPLPPGETSPPSWSATAVLASEISQVTLTVSPSSVISGGTSTLTWDSYNMNTCDADWTTDSVGVSGTDNVSPTTTTIYTISCSGTYGSDNSNATVTVISGAQAKGDSAEVNEFSYVNINVLNNDLGDNISVVSVTDGNYGTVVNNTTSVRYVNSSYGGGVDTFTYTIEDSFGVQSTATVVVTIYDCGDGVVQLYEECDEGVDNGVCPAGCSSSCVINDCSEPTIPSGDESVCGDDFCAADESFFTCPVDCPYTFEEF